MIIILLSITGTKAQVIRDNYSRKTCTIENGLVRDANAGKMIYFYEDNGYVRNSNGKLTYKINISGDVRDANNQLLLRFSGLDLREIAGYLIFFMPE